MTLPTGRGHPGQRRQAARRGRRAPASRQPSRSTVTTAGTHSIIVETEPLTPEQSNPIQATIEKTVGVTKADISTDEIGPSWGKEVAQRSLIGLVVFLVLVVLLIWGYFRQWKMSVAAIVALAHDLIITVGDLCAVGLRGHARPR